MARMVHMQHLTCPSTSYALTAADSCLRSDMDVVSWRNDRFNRQAFEALFDGRLTDADLMACRSSEETKECILRAAALPQPDPSQHFTDKHHIILVWPKGDQPFHARFIRKDAQQWTPGKCVFDPGRPEVSKAYPSRCRDVSQMRSGSWLLSTGSDRAAWWGWTTYRR
jgi:hypothetical protein